MILLETTKSQKKLSQLPSTFMLPKIIVTDLIFLSKLLFECVTSKILSDLDDVLTTWLGAKRPLLREMHEKKYGITRRKRLLKD